MRSSYRAPISIAFFITPHGFGHAARAASVMEAMHALNPDVRFEIFTAVPPWFFEDSITAPFQVHGVVTDVGLVQTSALEEDVSATVDRLDRFLPFDPTLVDELCGKVSRLKCRCVVCDIAPLGIAVASKAGIPSVLIENFTWDWIYQGYVASDERLKPHRDYLETIFKQADIHIQTAPLCLPKQVDFTAGPASRKPRQSREDARRILGVTENRKMVLITMGGIRETYRFIESLKQYPDVFFLIPGGADSVNIHGNIALIPHRSHIYHPDLVNAADAVIGKVGYSTLAEVYHAGIPFGFVPRPLFPESAVLSRFIEKHIPSLMIRPESFQTGTWLKDIHKLITMPKIKRQNPNGADHMAAFILHQLP